MDRIDIPTAQEFTTNWQADYPLAAFLLQSKDLLCLPQEPDIRMVRFYFGLNGDEPRILIVGARSDGKDFIQEGDQSGIFDFAFPCPAVCDLTSPLYNPESGGVKATLSIEYSQGSSSQCEDLPQIPLGEAQQWAEAWQAEYKVKASVCSLEDIQMILETEGAVSIRVYGGLTKEKKPNMILVATNEAKDDLTKAGVYLNEVVCSGNSPNAAACDTDSPLYFNTGV